MSQRVFVACITVIVFVAGFATHAWLDRDERIPAPPAAIAREMAAPKATATEKAKKRVDRAKLVAEIQKLKPQIDAYTAQVQEIEAEFGRELDAVLNASQREKRVAYLKRREESDAKQFANKKPLSDDDIAKAQDRPLTDIYWMVTVTPVLERITKEYTLDPAQQHAVRGLLVLRRNKYIALFDATPHPGVRMSKLAPLLERVVEKKSDPKLN
jgi:hypothetical protein